MMKNKRGMLAQLIGVFVVIVIGVTLVPMIVEQINAAIAESDQPLPPMVKTLLDFVALLFGLGILFVVISVAWIALKSGGMVGSEEPDEDDESDDEDDESDDEDDESDDEELFKEEEEPKPVQTKQRSTIVTTKKDGKMTKTNVVIGPGYNVDKYALDKPQDSSLTIKEETFNKSRFD